MYKIKSRHKKGFGIHSPFVYKLVSNIFQNNQKYLQYSDIESIRKELENSDKVIQTGSYGAGSIFGEMEDKNIATLVKQFSVNNKYGRLLFRMVDHFRPDKILELGTGMGISTAYLADHKYMPEVHSIEASHTYAEIAKKNMKALHLENVTIHNGLFNDRLSEVLGLINKPGLVFFDGDHRKEPMLDSFHQCMDEINNDTIFIFDDIHWSEEMEEAWTQITNNKKVTVSIDIFRMGIVFFKKELSEQHFLIRF